MLLVLLLAAISIVYLLVAVPLGWKTGLAHKASADQPAAEASQSDISRTVLQPFERAVRMSFEGIRTEEGWCARRGFSQSWHRSSVACELATDVAASAVHAGRSGRMRSPKSRSGRKRSHAVAAMSQLSEAEEQGSVEAGNTRTSAQVYFVGCARDVGAKLMSTMIPAIEHMGAHFADHKVVVFENDSSDDTRERLLAWVATGRGRVRALFAKQSLSAGMRSRTARLAVCRNTLLGEVQRASMLQRQHELPKLPELLVALDLDCKRSVSPEPVVRAATTLLGSNELSVLTANSMAGLDYYDLWALRSTPLHVDFDCWQRDAVRTRGTCDDYEVRLDAAAPLLEVDSAFNGLAVYRLGDLQQAPLCAYDGTSTCEHVAFHRCLRSYGMRIAIAPYLEQGCGDGAPRATFGHPALRIRFLANGSISTQKNRSRLLERLVHLQATVRPTPLLARLRLYLAKVVGDLSAIGGLAT